MKDEFSPINQQAKLQAAQKSRVSVSAEVFGKYHIKEAFKAQVIEKSHIVQDKIREKLTAAFMFMSLDDKDLQTVIDAMDEKHVKNKETVISEGEPGDVLYIVENGSYSCSKVIEGKETHLKNYGPGDVFGELALLYNAPRAATIEASSDGLLWVLDRNTFNHIVKDAAQKKRQKYEDFLQTVPILQNMDHYERSKLADAVKEKKFVKDDAIITQGE